MTETELTDRLREAIVLDGPDVWRTNGYLQDAQQAGLSLTDALKRATDITQEVANNSLLFQNIQARISRLAQPSRAHLIEQDLSQIINAATSLKLSPDFVRNRWVPLVLQRLATSTAPKAPEPPAVPPPPVVEAPVPVSDNLYEELSKPEPPEPEPQIITVREPEPFKFPAPPSVVEQPKEESSYNLYEPPPIVRSFTATPARIQKGQPVTLAWEVENLLAVTIDDLGEGLSPINRGWVKPTKSTDYTLFDANNNPLSTVRVEVIPSDRSGIYGVLFALALLAIIYWFIKSSNSTNNAPQPKHKTERTTGSLGEDRPSELTTVSHQKPEREPETSEATDTPAETPADPTVASSDAPKSEEKPIRKPTVEAPAVLEPKPATPADARQGKYEEAFGNKPYDKVELGADDRGWRRARSQGRWGYINENDEWVIEPEYEAVTPFKGNTASVFLNGQLMTINRNGEQVRN